MGVPEQNRPSWPALWIGFAQLVALRSHHPVFQVGAVVISADNTQVLSIGYNGDYKGGPVCPKSSNSGESGFIHAETNALLKLDYHSPKAKIMYLTLSPCLMCAKQILNAGILEVVYLDKYRDLEGLQLLSGHIKISQYVKD